MSANQGRQDEMVHYLKNQLSIILGFAELLAEQFGAGDPVRADVAEIQQAAQAALARLPELEARLSQEPGR